MSNAEVTDSRSVSDVVSANEIAPSAQSGEFVAANSVELPPTAGASLASKADRLVQAVDEAFVLANDGVIRWLGEPVARIAAGDTLLAPRAILTLSEGIDGAGMASVQSRLDLWLDAYIHRLLGPLFQLASFETSEASASEIAGNLSAALGVLDRARVRAQVKGLDQAARSTLRKLGIRFGAFYLFLPALMKPAHRSLAARLWALKNEHDASQTELEILPALASSGRTSFQVETRANRELYRVAGFRLCGDRAVRVDIVERLADIIRAGTASSPVGAESALSSLHAGAFVVTGAMTSLTGCSGAQFASILQSMGYVCSLVKRSEFTPTSEVANAVSSDIGSPEAQELAVIHDTPRGDLAGPANPADAPIQEAPTSTRLSEVEIPAPGTEVENHSPVRSEELVELWQLAPRRKGATGRSARSRPPSQIETAAIRHDDQIPSRDLKPPPRRRSRGSTAGPDGPRVFSVSWRGEKTKVDPVQRPNPASPAPAEVGLGAKSGRQKVGEGRLQPPKSSIDLNSPFAKLLEIRSSLDRKSDRHGGK